MITTNQTKQFCQSNQYYQHWLTYLDEWQNGIDGKNLTLNARFWNKHKRNPNEMSYVWTYEGKEHVRKLEVGSYNQNSNYCYAWKEFFYKFPELKNKNGYLGTMYSDSFFMDEQYSILYWSARYSMSYNGKWTIEIYDCRDGIEGGSYLRDYPFIEKNNRFEYNGILDKEHVTKATKEHIEKYLYPKGEWRDLQMICNWTKKQVKQNYRHRLKIREWYDTDYTELERTAREWIKRHFNIDTCNVDFEDGVDAVNRMGKQSKMVVLRRFSYDFIDDLDGDIDEAEGAFWQEMDNYEPNAVFVN